MAPRRSYGSGSIRERSPGVFQLRVTAGSDPITGKPRVITETFHGGKKAAQQRMAELVARYGGRAAPHEITLAAMIEARLDTTSLAKGTVYNYRTVTRLIPARLLATPISKVTPSDLESVYQHLARQGLSAARVRGVHNLMSATFNQAIRYGWLEVNPASRANAPRPVRRKSTTPEADTITRLLESCRETEPHLYLWLRLAAVSGARRNEVIAIRWRDFNATASTVTISGSIDIDRTRKTTKTGGSRTISLDPETVELLKVANREARERVFAIGVKLDDSSYVFCRDVEGREPWLGDVLTQRFRRLADRVGASDVRLHDLRHASASQLLANGVDLATISKRLGHARVSTTLDLYSHVTAGSDQRAAEVLGNIVGGRTGTS